MGLFKSVKKVFKKVAPIALPAAAAYFGAPYLSSALGGTAAAGAAAGTGGFSLSGILPSLVSGAASLGAGYLGYQGQQDANQMNAQIAEQNSAFNAAQAQKQMDFQERMANTTWQRGVADMKAAGLNPMLAYSQGGSPAPSGAAGQAVQPAAMQNAAGAGVAAAAQAASLDYIKAQTENVRADTRVKEADFTPDDYEAGKTTFKPKTYTVAERDARTRQLEWLAAKVKADEHLSIEQLKLVREEIRNAVKHGRYIEANTDNTKANTVLTKLQKAEREAYSKYYETEFGKAEPYAGAIGKALNSAGAAVQRFTPVNKTFNTIRVRP